MNETMGAPRTVPAGRGVDWIKEGYALFLQDRTNWIIITLIWLALFAVSMTLSTFVSLAFNLLAPVMTGGLMLGRDAQRRGETLRIDYLWAGFNGGKTGALLTVGVFGLLGMLLVGFGIFIAVGASMIGALSSGGGLESFQVGFSALLAILVALLIIAPLSMALWFAPALVVLHGLEPVPALKASFRGCLANIAALTLNGLAILPIAVVATIPFGLGWIIALPVISASIYFAYRDIFANDPSLPRIQR